MPRYSDRTSDAGAEALVKGIVVIMGLCALAVGGITHAAEAFVSLVVVGLVVLVAVGGLLLLWKAPWLKPTTKGAVTLFAAAGVSFWLFFLMQPPVEWPAVDFQVTKVIGGADSRGMVQGLVREGLLPVPVEMAAPAYAKPPSAGQVLRIYRNPEDESQFSVLPEVTDGRFRHLGLLAFAGVAFAGGAGCGVRSWRHRNDGPRALSAGARAPAQHPCSRPTVSLAGNGGGPGLPGTGASITGPAPTVESLREIDWYQFEKLMARLLKLEGYDVTRLGGAKPDGGVDVLAVRDGKRTVVQCKHWKKPVRPATVQQAIGIRVSQNADGVVRATLNSGTPAALELARRQGVVVTDADGIFNRMRRVGLGEFAGLLDPGAKRCPRCDAPMVLRAGGGKRFWGCANYGARRCTGTIEA
jgi:restriction system protein